MQLRQLRYFMAVAETLHFGRAAEQLHLSQPGLSQQIRALERDLDVVLFERGRQTRLTVAGAALAEAAGALLAHEEQVRTLVRRVSSTVRGTLRLALSRSAPTAFTHDLLEQFRVRCPEIELQTEISWTTHNIALLHSGEADAALVRLPLVESEFECVELATASLSAILPSGHRLAKKRTIRVDDVKGEPYIGWPRDYAPGAWDDLVADVWGEDGPPTVRNEPDLERMVTAVQDGYGFAIATRERARQMRRPGVVVRDFAEPAPHYAYGMCWSPHNVNPALVPLTSMLRAVASHAPSE